MLPEMGAPVYQYRAKEVMIESTSFMPAHNQNMNTWSTLTSADISTHDQMVIRTCPDVSHQSMPHNLSPCNTSEPVMFKSRVHTITLPALGSQLLDNRSLPPPLLSQLYLLACSGMLNLHIVTSAAMAQAFLPILLRPMPLQGWKQVVDEKCAVSEGWVSK